MAVAAFAAIRTKSAATMPFCMGFSPGRGRTGVGNLGRNDNRLPHRPLDDGQGNRSVIDRHYGGDARRPGRFRSHGRRSFMSSPGEQTPARPAAREVMPFMQRVLDNPFLLLFLGVVIPTVLYLVWAVME